MGFKMDGSPLNQGLNLFRKGRGKEYRQTKRAIKKQVRKTGGYSATAEADGKFTISGGSGATGSSQSGWARRNLARDASEAMTLGIDKKANLGGSDTQSYSGGVASKTQRSKTYTGDKGAYGFKGTGTKAGVTTTTSSDIDVTGPSVENVQGQITELQKDNPKGVSMKSTAFKMKYSPFNQGYGSPLNWKGKPTEGTTKKVKEPKTPLESPLPCNDCGDSSPLNQSSPLNEKTCPPKDKPENTVLKDGKCWKPGEVTTTTEEKDVDGVKETTDTTQTALERGKKGKKGKKVVHKPGTEEQEKTFAERCAKYKKKNSAAAKKDGCVWKEDTPDTPDTTEQDKLETKEVKAEGTATVITSVTDCPDGGKEYKLVDGKCIKTTIGGKADIGKLKSKKEKDCTPKDCSGNRTWDADKCRCVKGPKVEKEKKVKDKTCKGNKVWSEEKGRCVGVKKEKGDKKDEDCKCIEWDCE